MTGKIARKWDGFKRSMAAKWRKWTHDDDEETAQKNEVPGAAPGGVPGVIPAIKAAKEKSWPGKVYRCDQH